jgi:NAD-dependent deacetylase
MPLSRAPDALVVLCGGGLSKGSSDPLGGVGTFRGVPTDALERAEGDPELVRAWFDERRIASATTLPNPAHEALARMQHALSVRRCVLVTWTVDGLLQKASAEDVIEVRGSIFRLRCAGDPTHARVGVYGPQPRKRRCACGAELVPDVVPPGAPPLGMDRVEREVARADVLMAVGASGPLLVDLLGRARSHGARTIEVNPEPSGEPFDEVFAEPAEVAIPMLIGRWLGEDSPG